MTARLPVYLITALLIDPAAARANDSYLPAGGSAAATASHRSVSMQQEYVRMVVGEKEITVDCSFTFRNRGPACRVRMGFPDHQGSGEPPAHAPRMGFFRTFRSWVDGKAVKTSTVASGEYGDVWHVKLVRMPARGTVLVRDRYTVPVGRMMLGETTSASAASYLLHTGSTWRGPIGRSVVDVVIQSRAVKAPLSVKPVRRDSGTAAVPPDYRLNPHEVFYSGPCRPKVRGRTLRFVRTRWRPAETDDIQIAFGLRSTRSGTRSR